MSLFLLALVLVSGCATAPEMSRTATGSHSGRYPVIPAPRTLEPAPGEFVVGDGTRILVTPGGDRRIEVAELLASALATSPEVPLDVQPLDPAEVLPSRAIVLTIRAGTYAPEGYRLDIGPEVARLEAGDDAGLFYGAQTFLQLAVGRPTGDGRVEHTVPAVAIEDAPRFSYRGMHLDVGRHMFPVDFIKEYVALMARYKFNTFHWHLTEDQGWRIEIKRYPELTRIGAYRRETILEKNFDPYIGDALPYGGFYTQDEIRDVVDFAAGLNVTIIPEIEMPGHSVAALAAYPELACTDGPFEVRTVWGVSEDIYCPHEATFEFLENVLVEVMELFPGKYIHIGGDEAPKRVWRESPAAQAVIQREGLEDEHELQSYFIERIERFLLSHGRRLIGWDEILEGGLAPEATVMSWRGVAGGIEAAQKGHDVIMTPNSHLYFDYYQGDPATEPLAIGGLSTLENVYDYEPIPDDLDSTAARHVLGAQANLWTEYIKTPDHVTYMILPRMLALAEVVWSPQTRRDYRDFTGRLKAHFDWFDAAGLNYRLPTVTGLEGDGLTLQSTFTLRLGSVPDMDIFFTTDGRAPTEQDRRYERAVALDAEASGTVVTARVISARGHRGPISRAVFRKTTLRPPDSLPSTARGGISYEVVPGRYSTVRQVDMSNPAATGRMTSVGLPSEYGNEFGARYQGYLVVPEDAIYDFEVVSDDGSEFRIGDELVVDHDGLHGPTQKRGSIALARGAHAFTMVYFEAGGGKALRLRVRRNPAGGSATTPWIDVPEAWWRSE